MDTLAIAGFIGLLLLIGFFWSQDHQARCQERDDWRRLAEKHAAEAYRAGVSAEKAEADARTAREQRRGSFDANIVLARKRRESDEEAFRVAEEFRQHLDAHVCAPTLDGIRGGKYTRTEGDTPVYEGMTVVPIGSKRRRS